MVMRFKEKILYIVLSFFRLCLPFMKINKNKILFVSLESAKLENDFKLISNELQKQGRYELCYILVKFKATLMGHIQYFFVCIQQFFAINTSKLVILDYNNYVVSKFKRKGVHVLQLWHASGAIKKFGNEIERDYPIANYDTVIANSEEFREHYAKAFGVDKHKIDVTGIPKTDCLNDKEYLQRSKDKMYKEYPQIKGKKVILYAPTFRGRLLTGFKDAYMNLEYLYKLLNSEEYIVMYKMHPLLNEYRISENDNIICCNSVNLYQLFSVSDYLISDYSAIIFDYSLLGKPMLFYAPDLKTYEKENGIYIDYLNEMPGPICYTEEEIASYIKKNSFDLDKIKDFEKKYHAYNDGKSLERVVKLIQRIMK